jgi:hypothetical protein
VAALAALGVFSAVLMLARERVRDLGIFKAVGMTPRQVVTMVTCWVIALRSPPPSSPCPPESRWNTPWSVQSSAGRPAGSHGRPRRPAPDPLRDSTARPGLPRSGAGSEIPCAEGAHHTSGSSTFPGTAPSAAAQGSLPPQLAQLGTHLARAHTPGTLALLVLAGLAIAIMDALGPAIWVAATKTTTALHAE